ncbi:MAG: 5-oxoprolinase subunit PxpB [Thermicanus sp.]|nr:5-oxoprolinase subunit PxpB [Thermicanus sp.]
MFHGRRVHGGGRAAVERSSYKISPMGDRGVLVQLGDRIQPETHGWVRALSIYLDQHPLPGMVEYIPAFTSVALIYDLMKTTYLEVKSRLEEILATLPPSAAATARQVVIPVCYGGEWGPDLEFVARYHHMAPEEVITIHSEGEYRVYMIGFAPGFPYLGGLPERIATPRRATPRLKIPAGSVGIAGSQTGIYPIDSPGGWQIIGRTPLHLFRPHRNPPSLLQSGDRIRFQPISPDEFAAWVEEEG